MQNIVMDSSVRSALMNDVTKAVEIFNNAIQCDESSGLKSNVVTEGMLKARRMVLEKVSNLNELYLDSIDSTVVNDSPVKIDYEIERIIDEALRSIQRWIFFCN